MQQKILSQFVQSIIDSFTNVSVAFFRGLKAFLSKNTFNVKVTNPATKIKVEGEVKVSNVPLIVKAIGGVVLAINSLKKPLLQKKEVDVANFKDIKFPEFPKMPEHPKEMKISNMSEFIRAVEKIAEFLAKVKYDPRIEVNPTPVNVKAPVVNVAAPIVNVPEQKAPVVNVEAPDLSDIKKLMTFFEKLNVKNPLAVRLSDGQKYYKALEKMAEIYAGSTFSAFQTPDGSEGRGILNKNNELQVTTVETWSLNDVDTVNNGQFTYLGEETVDGRWRVTKITKVGRFNIMQYATTKNNEAAAAYDYPTAWTNHLTLDYGRVSQAL